MDETERWILFGGTAPESVRVGLTAMVRDDVALPPTPHDKARVMGGFLASFDERVARESRNGAHARSSDVYPVPSRPQAGDSAGASLPSASPLAATPRPAPEHLRGTAEALDLPAAMREAMGRLPFLPPAAAPQPASATSTPAAGVARTLKVRAMPSLGETMPVDSDAIQKAVAAVPFVAGAGGASGGAGMVAFPKLTVKQYLSLRAELALRPDQASETLGRYGVPNEAARRALEEHWRERLAASAELRAERDAALAAYVRWLRGEG